MRAIVSKFFMVPSVLLLLALSGCGSSDSGGTSVSGDGTQQLALTAEDTAAAKAIADSIASLDADTKSLAKAATPPVAGEIKVFGKKEFVIPRSGTLSVSKTFAGLVDGAEGTLVFYNSFGKDIPTTPCVGTAKQIKICEAARAIALALNPTSVEVILNGQTVIAPNQIPRTQGKALLPVTVNSSDLLQINLAGPKYSFIQLEVWSQPTAPVALNPTADFTYSPTTGTTPLSVVFDAGSSSSPNGSIVSYNWDFGDGVSDIGVDPFHTYYTAGTYAVTLTVIDSAGLSATKTVSIVANAPLPLNVSFTYTVDSSTGAIIVTADASGSSSPNGSIISYLWDFGDGTGPFPGTMITSYTYAVAGTYNVTLVPTDSSGTSGTVTQTITVP